MIYIGIDPGLNGAVGVLQEDALIGPHGDIDVYSVFDTPTMVVSGVKDKRVYHTTAMALLLKPFSTENRRGTIVTSQIQEVEEVTNG